MEAMREMIRLTKKRIINSKYTSVLFIICLFISIIMISIASSFTYSHLKMAKIKANSTPPNGTVYSISGKSGIKLSGDEMVSLLKGVRKNTGIMFNGLMVHPDNAKINSYYPVTVEWFDEEIEWHYPLISGRYYTNEEMKNGDNVILVGRKLLDIAEAENGKRYLLIEGVKYLIVGVVGVEDDESLWDNRIFFHLKALPKFISDEMKLSYCAISMVLYNPNGDVKKDKKMISDNGKTLDPDFTIKRQGKLQTENMLEQLIQSKDPIYTFSGMAYLVTIVLLSNVIAYWSEKRKYEIGIRKALGYSNRQIAKIISNELLGLSLVSAGISLLVQLFINLFFTKIWIYQTKIYWVNIIVSIVIVFITVKIIAAIPIRRAIRMNPINAIKEGQND